MKTTGYIIKYKSGIDGKWKDLYQTNTLAKAIRARKKLKDAKTKIYRVSEHLIS